MPLSVAMDVRVLEAGPDAVRIEAPLAPNLNHRSTAFGGSVAALAILTGWTLVHVRLRSEGLVARTVIQDSAVHFAAPIHGSFRAVCGRVADEAWDRFTRALARRGKGRLLVAGHIEADGQVVATFSGAYVALRGE
jgi:thioesterase domain-containing protein